MSNQSAKIATFSVLNSSATAHKLASLPMTEKIPDLSGKMVPRREARPA